MKYSFAERIWFQSAFLILALIPIALVAGQIDDRMLNGISIWTKPVKFYVSTPVHLITLAVLVRFVPDRMRTATWLSAIAAVSAAATIVEILPLTGQAARGVASHFNSSTPLDSLIYAVMGVGALLMILPALVLGVGFLRLPASERLTPGLKLGAGLGLLFGFVLTLIMGGYMSQQPGGHWVDAPLTDDGGVPIFGWSRQGGDLRVPHFFATHLMQALPLIGFIADKQFSDKSTMAKRIVWLATIIGVSLAVGTFLQALAGEPFIR